jgi:hypothetical protein
MKQSEQINLSLTESIQCDCGNETFNQIFFIRRLPAVVSPTLRTEMMPLPSFECRRCRKIIDLEQKKTEKTQKKEGILSIFRKSE